MGEHGEFCKFENLEVVTRIPLLVYVPGLTDRFSRKAKNEKFQFIDVLKNPRTGIPEKGNVSILAVHNENAVQSRK